MSKQRCFTRVSVSQTIGSALFFFQYLWCKKVWARISRHVNTKDAIPPTVLDDPVTLFDEDFLRFHLLESRHCLLNFLQLLPFLPRTINFNSSAHVLTLSNVWCNFFNSRAWYLIKCLEIVTFFVEWNLPRESLLSKGGESVSSDQTGRCFSLLIHILSLHLVLSRDADKGSAWAYVCVNGRSATCGLVTRTLVKERVRPYFFLWLGAKDKPVLEVIITF